MGLDETMTDAELSMFRVSHQRWPKQLVSLGNSCMITCNRSSPVGFDRLSPRGMNGYDNFNQQQQVPHHLLMARHYRHAERDWLHRHHQHLARLFRAGSRGIRG